MMEFIVFLRCLATCLITNSHFDNIWPIAELATGGALGNSIFFFVSGYCLSVKQQGFIRWICNKSYKLYIPLWIVQLFCTIIGIYKFDSIIQVFKMYVLPTNYWFLPAILIGYCVMYLWDYVKLHGKLGISIMCFGIMIGRYFAFEISQIGIESDFIVKTAFYLLVMQIGYICRKNSKVCNRGKVISVVGVFIGIVGTYGWKILEGKVLFFYSFQLGEYVFLGCFVCCLYALCKKNENCFKSFASYKGWTCIRWIAERSWVIYLVQVPLLHNCKFMNFPISMFVNIVLIFLGAMLVNVISCFLLKQFELCNNSSANRW